MTHKKKVILAVAVISVIAIGVYIHNKENETTETAGTNVSRGGFGWWADANGGDGGATRLKSVKVTPYGSGQGKGTSQRTNR